MGSFSEAYSSKTPWVQLPGKMGSVALTRYYSLPKREVPASRELTKLINTLFYLLTKFVSDEESTEETTTVGTTEGITTTKPTEVTTATTESARTSSKS